MVNKLLKPRDKLSRNHMLCVRGRARARVCVCVFVCVYMYVVHTFAVHLLQQKAESNGRLSATPIRLTARIRLAVVGSGVHTLSFGRSCTSGTSERSIPSYDKVREKRVRHVSPRRVLSTTFGFPLRLPCSPPPCLLSQSSATLGRAFSAARSLIDTRPAFMTWQKRIMHLSKV